MRTLGLSLLLSLTLGTACKRAAEQPADAAVSVEAGASDGSASALVTDAQLDAYARYQRVMIGVYESLFRELEKVGNRKDGGPTGIPPQVRVVESKALAEEQARKDAGLTEAELQQVEPLVLDVLNARALARSLDAHDQVEELTAMRDQLQGEAREGIDETLTELKRDQEEAARLAEVRSRYGDENVDRVLRHEAELTRSYELWLSRVTGGAASPPGR